jgi:exosortase A
VNTGSDRIVVGRNPPFALDTTGTPMIFLAMITLAACTFLLYAGTFASMMNVWANSTTFVHGYFILPISAFVIWQKRSALHIESARPSLVGFGFLLAAVFFWLLASEANVQVGEHLAFIAILCTSIWAALGTDIARAIRFPLLFAFFAAPFSEVLIPPLMAWTAVFTVWALDITGIPVYLEGYHFSLPSGNFEVAEACSGIRYLLVTVVLGIFFAYERFSTLKGRIVFVLSAAIVMVVANGIRAYLIVLIAHYSAMEYGTGQDHIYFGWFIFFCAILLTFWVGTRFSDRSASEVTPHAAKVPRNGEVQEGHWRSMILWLIVAYAVIGIGPLAQQMTRSLPTGTSSHSYLPLAAGSWTGPAPPHLEYRPGFRGSTKVFGGSYLNRSELVEVHGVFFAQQTQGYELIGRENRIFDSEWRPVKRADTKFIWLDDDRRIRVNRLVVTDSHNELLLWYWYDISGRQTSSEIAAKLYHAIQNVFARNEGDALLVLATPVTEAESDQESALLQTFLALHFDQLNACLRTTAQVPPICSAQKPQVR